MIRKSIRLWAWLLILSGLYLGYSGFSEISSTLGSWLFEESVEGKVVGHSSSRVGNSLRSKTLIAPVVQFTTEQGQTLTFTDRVQHTGGGHNVGERVKVHYDPDHPEQAAIATSTLWTGTAGILGILFAVVLNIVGLLILLAAKLPWQLDKSS
ncbi:DUF3592 domain-containing protein [Pseudomonas sp. EA_35y_Pfl2_R111]|uniref:DUF3592 domain-containing protein n=1 Tax=Pseudomonas sp. EA_35y_Pfl2_R111 TaxID=3088689 RepID=UPI0030DA0744